MIRPIHMILLIYDKMDIQVRPRIFPYLNHRTRMDLNVLLLRILDEAVNPWNFRCLGA